MLDLAKAHGWIVELLQRSRDVAASMNALIDRGEAEHRHRDWAELRRLSYDDLTSLNAWIHRPFADERPARPLKGLWFGLFNPCDEDGDPVADIYVCGSERFDPDPADNSWAVGPDWWPDARHAGSKVLAGIYRIAYRPRGLGNDAEYPLCLGYGACLLSRICG